MPEVATPEAAQVCLGRTPAVVFFFRDGLPAVLNFRRVRNTFNRLNYDVALDGQRFILCETGPGESDAGIRTV